MLPTTFENIDKNPKCYVRTRFNIKIQDFINLYWFADFKIPRAQEIK